MRNRVHLHLALAMAASASAFAQAPAPRQVAAPASDILNGIVRLPNPADASSSSSAAILPLRFERGADGTFFADLHYPVERDGTLSLALLSPDASRWRLLGAPSGEPLRPIDVQFKSERSLEPAGESFPGWIIDQRRLRDVTAGSWSFRVEAPSPAEGWWIATASPASGDSLRAEAYVTTQRLVAGSPIAVAARASGAEMKAVARARVTFEVDGRSWVVAMHDDGLHDDVLPNDGWFGAFLPEEISGLVRGRVELLGTTQFETAFLRTVQIAFPVLEPAVMLEGTAVASTLAPGALRIAIRAWPLAAERRLHVSAEVWGRDVEGEPVAVCWLSKMLAPEVRAGAWDLGLDLDLDWLDISGAGSPLELRAVRVQDPDTEAVFDFAPRMALENPAVFAARTPSARPVSAKLLTGSSTFASSAVPAPPAQNFAYNRALMLVHGYCSGGSIWPAADFSAPKLEFLDPSANRSHDQFAQLIAQRAAQSNLSSFGIVAHSQGGPAALHLLTYYTSGLDNAFGGRRIQALASPFQGTPLASWGGFACGVNSDMTPAGSATWLAGIPTWARAEVFTWTTANSGSACSFLTNLLLTDPEDGTVEKFRSELTGANNMGHVVGWCHTTGMTNPASYTDHARNLLMNAAAAR